MATDLGDFAEFHDDLRAVASELLAKDSRVEWPALVEAGWPGLEISTDHGGAGAGFAEVAIVCREIGKAAATTAMLGSVLAVGALKALQPTASRDAMLSGVASGSQRAAVALGDFRLAAGRLSGRAEFVPDAVGADRLLVLAEDEDSAAPVVVDAASDTPGLGVTAQPVLDETRRMAVITANGVVIPEAATLRFAGDARCAAAALNDRAAVAVAVDSLGLSEAMLASTVDYVKMRTQFGQPIGSFQAVKHACADMLVNLTVSRQLVTAAIAEIAAGDSAGPKTGPDAGVATAMAKAHACTTAVEIAGKAMQLHGGIGYTWESGIHVYLKRAAFNRSLFGSAAAHRNRLADRYRSISHR